MEYELFISYARADNQAGRVTQLLEQIKADFQAFAGRPLNPFFDTGEIAGMQDWRHRILQGVQESRLLLACISPAYLHSEFCELEFNEYLKHELARAYLGEGVAPIYFVEVPGWDDKDFEARSAAWVAELRCRQHVDLRPWFHEGEAALRDAEVKSRLDSLGQRIVAHIRRGESEERRRGNLDRHNEHFVGRVPEMRRLHELAGLGRLGVLTAVTVWGASARRLWPCSTPTPMGTSMPGAAGRFDVKGSVICGPPWLPWRGPGTWPLSIPTRKSSVWNSSLSGSCESSRSEPRPRAGTVGP